MKKELQYTSQLVKLILEQDEKARNSDNYLYLRVLESIAASRKWNISLLSMSVSYFLLNMSEMGAPGFETVRRSRQKIQRQFPELAGSDAVGKMRTDREKAFREFARGDAV